MSTVAAIQNAKVAEFSYRNACLTHGVPYEDIDASVLALIEIAKDSQDEDEEEEETPEEKPVAVQPIEIKPIEIKEPIKVELPDRPEEQPPASNLPDTPPDNGATTPPVSFWKKILPWLVPAAAIVTAGALITWGILNQPITTPPVTEPVETEQSAFQYLEDRGFHLP